MTLSHNISITLQHYFSLNLNSENPFQTIARLLVDKREIPLLANKISTFCVLENGSAKVNR